MVANFHADEIGISKNFEAVEQAFEYVRAHKTMDKNWKDEIDKDFSKRAIKKNR